MILKFDLGEKKHSAMNVDIAVPCHFAVIKSKIAEEVWRWLFKKKLWYCWLVKMFECESVWYFEMIKTYWRQLTPISILDYETIVEGEDILKQNIESNQVVIRLFNFFQVSI